MSHLNEHSKLILENTASSIVDLSIISNGMTVLNIKELVFDVPFFMFKKILTNLIGGIL